MDSYTFSVTIGDSGDEFSEDFNAKDPEQVAQFERDITATLEESDWPVESIDLVVVTTRM